MRMTTPDVNLRFEFSVDLGAVRRRRTPRKHGSQRLPRIRYLLLLGDQLERAVNGDPAKKYVDVARAVGMTTSWLAQVVAMVRLAPDIQDEILTMDDATLAQIPERMMRPLLREAEWERQRAQWQVLVEQACIKARLTL